MQQIIKHKKWMPVLMALTILGIAGFQFYWLQKAFEREERTLEIRSNMGFRETVYQLQASKLKLDKINSDSLSIKNIRLETNRPGDKTISLNALPEQMTVTLANQLKDRMGDSGRGKKVGFERHKNIEADNQRFNRFQKRDRLIQFLYDVDSLQDSITVKEITAAYDKRMQQQNIDVPFVVTRLAQPSEKEREFNQVTIGFKNPITYRLSLQDTLPFLLKRISAAVLLSLFLVGFTIVSFTLLYRNLLKQQRLANIKNEFISNITHELKTPIATVSVAIEALRSFNASMDAQKTKEYLDISANELQRLSLLVDKVLKLSMFENKEIDLKYELLDMQSLVTEVTSSMRLQFEKNNAAVSTSVEGETTLEGDRLHLVSVIYNLVDNALKYSKESPKISINIQGHSNKINLIVSDSGIGIPAEYKDKVFEKFFRVPTGNLHNAKGYGLGLSYVAHVVKKHKGTITAESAEGEGSRFIITLP
ncbi:MAG TPA: HAMP domain-containing sensor histidine kinase, partial [Chitinophagaceae bacterium]|nr:HAMP domain-containing sensor histidine kinase [Chitinophagaceae bacterium]